MFFIRWKSSFRLVYCVKQLMGGGFKSVPTYRLAANYSSSSRLYLASDCRWLCIPGERGSPFSPAFVHQMWHDGFSGALEREEWKNSIKLIAIWWIAKNETMKIITEDNEWFSHTGCLLVLQYLNGTWCSCFYSVFNSNHFRYPTNKTVKALYMRIF